MNIPYRTRRKLQRAGTVLLFLLMIAVIAWFCWVIWLERYVVYTRDGATLDFDRSAEALSGEVALPPDTGNGPEIHFNEGANAINVSTDLTQLNGYYITYDMLSKDLDGVVAQVSALSSGTAVMIDMKGGYGTFYYSSELEDATMSQSVDTEGVDELITLMKSKNLYMIAQISAYQDYIYALNHVSSGIPFTGGHGALWLDSEGCYWLKPTDSGVLGYLTSIILELKGLGFNEVVLNDFSVPTGDRIVYDGDRDTDLLSAANTLLTSCSTTSFTVSFSVSSATFPLPEGRCRMYLSGVTASSVEATAAQVTMEDPQIRLVFIADTNDTRFDNYGVLRSLEVSEVLSE